MLFRTLRGWLGSVNAKLELIEHDLTATVREIAREDLWVRHDASERLAVATLGWGKVVGHAAQHFIGERDAATPERGQTGAALARCGAARIESAQAGLSDRWTVPVNWWCRFAGSVLGDVAAMAA
jgi:hypothetical protein